MIAQNNSKEHYIYVLALQVAIKESRQNIHFPRGKSE